MAAVWVARQIGKHGFEKQVAVKTILPEFAEDPRFQKMFMDEAHIASNIEHANVAQILDLGEEHGVLYLVMELVDGESLGKLHRVVEKRDFAVPIGVTLRILADACGGLHAAHELHDRSGALLGVVHRDVSPQNILVTSKGTAKLIDFGVAKARDRIAGETNGGALKGKIHYMAPEQAVGKTLDRRADIWGVGAIAYHLLSGRPAYEGPNQLATLHRLTAGRPPAPLPDTIPAAVVALIARTLVHDVEQRIATAHELQLALEQAMVDARCETTHADVAVFVREHLGGHAKARRKSVELAMAAANERARINKALQLDADASSSLTDIPERIAALNAAQPRSDPPTVPGLPSNKKEISSSGTMSALESTAPAPQRRRRAVALVAGISAACALLLVYALVRRPEPVSKPTPTAALQPFEPAAVSAAPVVALVALPAVTASASSSVPAVVKPKVVAPKPKTTANAKKKKIDDGF